MENHLLKYSKMIILFVVLIVNTEQLPESKSMTGFDGEVDLSVFF